MRNLFLLKKQNGRPVKKCLERTVNRGMLMKEELVSVHGGFSGLCFAYVMKNAVSFLKISKLQNNKRKVPEKMN